MKVPDARKVSKALSVTDKAIKTCLRAVNQNAAKLMGRGDYSGAQSLASIGTQVQSFRFELDALRKKWNGIWGGGEEKSKKNSATPLWGYYQPILQALVSLGGEGRRPDVEPQVEQLMKDKFQPRDHDVVSRGRARWQLMIRRAHRHIVKEGWLENHAGKLWRITPAGRQAAKAETSVVTSNK
jgi:Mrr N-terminal domain